MQFVPSGGLEISQTREWNKCGPRQWQQLPKAQPSPQTLGDVPVHINSVWIKSCWNATAKKIGSNWKPLYCQRACWALEVAEFVKQLPFV